MSQSVAPADQLTRRSKELDARETYLATREQLAEDTEQSIAQGQRDLALLDSTILARELILSEQQTRMTALDKEYIRKGIVLENNIAKQEEALGSYTPKIEALKADLAEIRASIAERKQYYDEQEQLIVKQAADGNLQLRGLEYAIIEGKQIIKDLKLEQKNVRENNEAVLEDMETARQAFLPELERQDAAVLVVVQRRETVEAEVATVQGTLTDLNKQVSSQLIKRQQIHDDVDAKLLILDEKERKIMAEREALRVEREEMDESKHYWQSPKSLYDLP